MGDPLKVNCVTCHHGINRPLGAPKCGSTIQLSRLRTICRCQPPLPPQTQR
ncbi:hypothetical protein [Polymorphobacter multimanifer]|uniref:hypothetical protein n=1 Tax=Polymorphobacter multimanifer TaxID=1070431 RepID=UPI001A9C6AD0